MTDYQYIATTDTAKLLRKMLKAAFPETKFSVRSHSYSGGSSIHIGWVDGPTSKAVDALAKPLEGASFDGMQDLKTYNGPLVVAGARVRFGGHFIFTERKHSSALLEFALGKVCDWWRCQPCEIAVSKYDSSYAYTTSDGERNVGGGYFSTSDLVHQLTSVTSAVGGTFAFDDANTPSPREVIDELPADRAKAIRDDAFRAVFPAFAAAAAANPATETEDALAKEDTEQAENALASEPPVPDNVIIFPARPTPEMTARQSSMATGVGRVVDSLLLLRMLSDRIANMDESTIAQALERAARGLAISIPETST